MVAAIAVGDRRTSAGISGEHGRRRPCPATWCGGARPARIERSPSRLLPTHRRPQTELSAIDSKIADSLQEPGLGPTLRTVEYRALAAGDGRVIRFAGLDGLQQVTKLIDGSWPTRCDAERCEVVAIVPDAWLPTGRAATRQFCARPHHRRYGNGDQRSRLER